MYDQFLHGSEILYLNIYANLSYILVVLGNIAMNITG